MLAATAAICVVNGLNLDHIPAWRQLLFVVLAVAAYLHGRHLPSARDWLVPAAAALPGAVYLVVDPGRGAGALMGLALFVVLPWLAGRFRRQQADLVSAGRERIAQLEREQELIADQAGLRERARIAADMHDSLGHELALIAIRAGALELAADMTHPNQQAAAALRASAVTATDLLRGTVGTLRATATVEALVEHARAAGLTVSLHREGTHTALPPATSRAVHRVVQESLTNAARHAPGAEVTVRLLRSSDKVTVTVRNNGPRAAPAPSRTEGGSGLAGLRERVRVLGGTLRARPEEGGFVVTAQIPVREETG